MGLGVQLLIAACGAPLSAAAYEKVSLQARGLSMFVKHTPLSSSIHMIYIIDFSSSVMFFRIFYRGRCVHLVILESAGAALLVVAN